MRRLTVQKTGSGQGALAARSNGNPVPELACGDDCSQAKEKDFNRGATVTLEATPEGSGGTNPSRFTGWKALDGTPATACSGSPSAASCEVSMSEARTIVAAFTAIRPLTAVINRIGTGNGAVTTTRENWENQAVQCGAGIANPRCSLDYDLDTEVTLTANPTSGSIFLGWAVDPPTGQTVTRSASSTSKDLLARASSDPSTQTASCTDLDPTCSVTLSQARTVEATFTAAWKLTLEKGGTGSGSVLSDPEGINCGSACTTDENDFAEGTEVTLTAIAAEGSRFTGWSSNCTVVDGKCKVTMSEARTVTASFTRVFGLTLNKTGNGSGTVSSSPVGINCGTTCTTQTAQFDENATVTLTATAPAGSRFTGWSGAGCSGTGDCQVTMSEAKSVTANFTKVFDLNVSKSGSGSGAVSSNPSGIDCGSDCTGTYDDGTSVTLTAAAATGSRFVGWSGAGCSGTGTCEVTMDQARSVDAEFIEVFDLTVNKSGSGSGSGSVSSSPAGIDCGSDCTGAYDDNTVVTLTATAPAGTRFTGWSGAGCSGTGTCQITMSEARTVTASFIRVFDLNVSKSGSGSGAVSSNPSGIDCGSDCTGTYDDGTLVTLSASAASGSRFVGWSGAGCSGTGTCEVTMDQARSVDAEFIEVFDLHVTRSGTGSGSVSSSPAGIDCGSDCSERYDDGAVVALTASAEPGSSFTSWGGACAGIGTEPPAAPPYTCDVTMSEARSVTATFTADAPPNLPLQVTRVGDGTGTITSSPAGVECLPNCVTQTVLFPSDTEVTLTAQPSQGSSFTGWSGEGCFGSGTCVVTMDQARSVTATFTADRPPVRPLSVSRKGNGSGSVTSSPSGIDCGSTCSTTYDEGQVVTLRAEAGPDSRFTGWTGACSGTRPTCEVTMSEARSVTATFTASGPKPPDETRLRLTTQVDRNVLEPGQSTIQKVTVKNVGKNPATVTWMYCWVCRRLVPVKVVADGVTTKAARSVRQRGSVTRSGRKISWKIGTLRPGAKKTMRIRVKAVGGSGKRANCPAIARASNAKSRKVTVRYRLKQSKPKRPPAVTG